MRTTLRTAATIVLVVAMPVTAALVLDAGTAGATTQSVDLTTPGTSAFVVPPGVTTITVDAYGAQGGAGGGCTLSAPVLFCGTSGTGGPGGAGSHVRSTVTVTPNESLTVVVGGQGGAGTSTPGAAGTPGGGATGGTGSTSAGGGGGGASSVARGSTLLVVGGGGAGGGGDGFDIGVVCAAGCFVIGGTVATGGAGGGGDTAGSSTGSPGLCDGGGGGAGSAGGGAGTKGSCGPGFASDGTAGSAGTGGAGGAGSNMSANGSFGSGGGGGGGGAVGGGGGGGGDGKSTLDVFLEETDGAGGGGGGGGSLCQGACLVSSPSVQTGNGRVVITYDLPGGSATVGTACGTVTLASSIGTPTNVTATPVPASPAPPAGLTLPCGLIGFSVPGLSPGASATITVTLPITPSAYWKLQNGQWSQVAGATVAGKQISFTLTDGGVGDADGSANGTIVDPGGPAAAVVARFTG